jgi:hypothetical protein
VTDNRGNFGHYGSYFNNCDLIFNWYTGADTLFDIEIIKSKEAVSGCYKNDPNVKIDRLSFIHKGMVINKNQTIQINK